jgi:hypothetical protein
LIHAVLSSRRTGRRGNGVETLSCIYTDHGGTYIKASNEAGGSGGCHAEQGGSGCNSHNRSHTFDHWGTTVADSSLVGEVTVNTAAKTRTFIVQFGDRDNALDPLPFTERVRVTCAPIERIDTIQCREEKM